MNEKVLSVVTGENDVEKAARFKRELAPHLTQVCEIFTTAKKDGINLSFMINFDGLGKAFVAQIGAVKEL